MIKRVGGSHRIFIVAEFCVLLMLAGEAFQGCAPIGTGLDIESPEHPKSTTPAKITTLTPTFRWKPFTTSSPIQNLHYHLVVMAKRTETEREQVVVDKSDLVDLTFTVQEPLTNHRQYVWRVRPGYTLDGKLSESPWSGYRNFWFIGIAFGWTGVIPYAFETAVQ